MKTPLINILILGKVYDKVILNNKLNLNSEKF